MKREGTRGKIIFDMDGVIIKEDRYWDAAALTVWELLYSDRYLGLEIPPGLPAFKTAVPPREIAMIRRVILQEGEVVSFFKQRAINSNLDLAFLTFVCQLLQLLQNFKQRGLLPEGGAARRPALLAGTGQISPDLQELGRLLQPAAAQTGAPQQFAAVLGEQTGEARGEALLVHFFNRLAGAEEKEGKNKMSVAASPLWSTVRDVFQEWYLGDNKYKETYGRDVAAPGKQGLFGAKANLLPVPAIEHVLNRLLEQGWVLGIATGRSRSELQPPLAAMGIEDCFESSAVVTRDLVQEAEETLQAVQPGITLGKPHPYSFLRAYWGNAYSDRELVFSGLPLPPPGRCWAVGDSLADLLSARGAGAFFIGVLTGPLGAAAAGLFRQEGARLVLPDITHIPDCLEA